VATHPAVIFGAGNIGRGFIGQLFSESGYEITFVDVDTALITAMAERHEYVIEMVEGDQKERVTIAPVEALHSARQAGEVEQRMATAELAATAVGARVLPIIAPLVAAGIRRRAVQGLDQPLNIIVCENLKDAAHIFREMVELHLNESERAYARECVGFVDTVIGRMVPPPTPEMRARDVCLIQVEPYKELPVDRRGFVGAVPALVGLEAIDNFPAYTARKLYLHNCGHAVLAYFGHLRGYEYGYQALQDPAILAVLKQAQAEASMGIVAAHQVSHEWLAAHCDDLLRRFANQSLGDTVFRLGRDPMRKLAPTDRLVGAARLVEQAGLVPQALCMGIAAAYCFDAAGDDIAMELQGQIAAQGFEQVLSQVSGIQADEPLGKMVCRQYHLLKEGR
jgi:mannitol-1-phosphate 5-dehydrogenase